MSSRRTKSYIVIGITLALLVIYFLLSLVPAYKNSQQSTIHCGDRNNKIGDCAQVMVRTKVLSFGAPKKYVAIITPHNKGANPSSSIKDGGDLLSISSRYVEVAVPRECVVSYQSSYWDEKGLHIVASSGEICLVNRQQIGDW